MSTNEHKRNEEKLLAKLKTLWREWTDNFLGATERNENHRPPAKLAYVRVPIDRPAKHRPRTYR